jgi:ATP-dependent Lhr-like helicase
MIRAVHPDAPMDPVVDVPEAFAKEWERDDAIVEILRGRLEGLGPTTADEIAASVGLSTTDVDAGLIKLESEGFAMRGQFDPALGQVQWCERGLLARIHRYTVKRLRAEIEPVTTQDFLRFLFSWQHVTHDARMQGPDSVAAILGQLEGFEAPAASWETEVLPARIAEYEPTWLDDQCLAGRFIWTRLAARAAPTDRGAAPVRATPIAWLARRNTRIWSSFTETHQAANLTPKARMVLETLQAHGASFFGEIGEHSALLPTQVEEALAELVALGLVNSDSFSGMRALLVPADRRRPHSGGRRRRRLSLYGMEDAGRWALIRRSVVKPAETEPGRSAAAEAKAQALEAIEHVARTLLNRWGVVFWRVLEREANWLPSWRELLTALRRLEARGEVRGGRFIAGISGEQFALPEAVGLLRNSRRETTEQGLVSLSAADPLNLIGILTPGGRVPSLTGNRVLYRDGLPIATYVGGEVQFLVQLEVAEQWQAHNALVRRAIPETLQDLA